MSAVEHRDALDAELRPRDLRLDRHDALADLGGGGVDLDERLAAVDRQPHARGRVVVEALGEADVLEADAVADAAPTPSPWVVFDTPPGSSRRSRVARAPAVGRQRHRAQALEQLGHRRGLGDRPGRSACGVPGVIALRMRRSTGSMPSAAASLSICASWPIATWTAPKPRIAPHGAVQVAIGHEAQMDKLAAALGMDPVDLRIRNAMTPGSLHADRPGRPRAGAGGRAARAPAGDADAGRRGRGRPGAPARDLRELPGGVSNTTHGEGVRRGVGYAIGFKNVGFSEGFDDYSTARVRLSVDGGEPLVEVHTAAAEVGQGVVTVQAQIARTELGVERVAVLTADTRVGSAGSSSASRQTYVTGGAVKAACEAVRDKLLALAAERLGSEPASLADALAALPVILGDDVVEETIEWHHRETFPLDENGQGDAHLQFAFSAHRAVVDVDCDLGLVRVVDLATTQEVGRAMNPQALEGQIEGGTAQGLGLALLEEIHVRDGKVLNASFTDYLLPTVLDMPPVQIEVLEHADPEAPYGLKGVGEPPNISTPPAVAAALRDATGRDLKRVPVRPEHIVGLDRTDPEHRAG